MRITPASAAPDSGEENIFRNDGGRWILQFEARRLEIPDARGLHYIAALLTSPGYEARALDLVALARPPRPLSGQFESDEQHGQADAERARASVTLAIKGAIRRIAVAHPSLAHHLATTIRTGTICRYIPHPEKPVFWLT